MAESGGHWSKIGESGSVLGMRLMLLTYRVFGRRGFMFFLAPVMLYYYLFKAEAREASRQYLRRVADLLPPHRRSRLSPFRHFMRFGEILLDKLLAWMGEIRREDVIFETPETIAEFEANRDGGIIIVSHLGNFEVCSALARDLPRLRMTLLEYTRHAEKFNRILRRVGGKTGVEIMQVTQVSPVTAMLLAERINAGEYVVIAGDRTPISGDRRITRAPFLGSDAPLPQGAFILAGLLKCPVYLMFCLKLQGQYHLYIEHFASRLQISDRAARQTVLDDSVRRYARRLEHYCLEAPLQWFNFFPYWGDADAQGPETLSRKRGAAGLSRGNAKIRR